MMTPLEVDSKKYPSPQKGSWRSPLLACSQYPPGRRRNYLNAHKILRKEHPDLLTILVPRHIERATSLQQLALKEGVSTALRTETTSLEGVEVYIGNTLGEMGLFYALSPVVLMGATLVPKGGHNPIEAAQLGSVCPSWSSYF